MAMKTVLIVDDDPDTLEIIGQILSSSYEVKTVLSRDEALEVINAGFQPSCVLMDYMMPGMTLEEFLKHPKTLHLRIVLMTGHGDAIRISELAGLSSSLQKPLTSESILQSVQSIAGT
jgi:CheY-like chemotaxis protein